MLGPCRRDARGTDTLLSVTDRPERGTEGRSRNSNRRPWGAIPTGLVVAAAAFAVHLPALFGEFVYDDMTQVLQNRWIRDLGHLGEIFRGSVWSFQAASGVSNYYRPAMHVIYALEYQLFGLKPWGFHLVNLFLHAGVSVLVLLLVRRLFADLGGRDSGDGSGFLTPAFAAALLFATHPVNTEAIAWVAAVPELSFTLFGLLAFLSFRRSEGGWGRFYWLSVGLFFAATLCKETAFVLPALLALYEILVRKPPALGLLGRLLARLVPFGAAGAVTLALRLHALSGFAPEKRWPELSTLQCALNATTLFAKYLLALVLPVGLNAFHVLHPVRSPLEPLAAAGLLGTAAFLAASAFAWRRSRLAFFGLLVIAVPLFPVLYIRVVGENAFAERYLYLPSIGFALLAALLLFAIGRERARFAILATVALLFAAGSFARTLVWKDNFALFADTAAKSPDHFQSQASFANALYEKGEVDAAIQRYRLAIALDPGQCTPRQNLATAYLRKGLVDEAIAELTHPAVRNAGDPEAAAKLAFAYTAKGWLAAAVTQYEEALRLDPKAAEVHNNLGVTLCRMGLNGRSAEHFAAALALEPGNRRYAENLKLVAP